MSRTLKLIALLVILEMILVDIGVVLFAGANLNGHDPHHRYLFQLIFLPAWMLFGAAYAGRRLSRQTPRLSDTHRRYIETGFGVALIVTAGVHGVVAFYHSAGLAFDRLAFVRLLMVFVGAAMVVQGNYAAKIDPPIGEGAPPAALWTRTMMRFGWLMVVAGLGEVACSAFCPPTLFGPLALACIGIGVAAEISYRRMTRMPHRA